MKLDFPGVFSTWRDVLRNANRESHVVQTYQDDAFLVEAVSFFIAEGLKRDEAVVIVAPRANREMYIRRLKQEGFDPHLAIEQGRLWMVDAQELLDQLLKEGVPQVDLFNAIVEPLLQKAQGEKPFVRVHGEMVNLLYHQGNKAGAAALEKCWNASHRRWPFALFCSYQIDPFNLESYSDLVHLCPEHSHFIPVQDETRLTHAVDLAIEETLGSSLAGMLRTLEASDAPATIMPEAQHRLFWLHKNMPGIGKKVLELTRYYYRPDSPHP